MFCGLFQHALQFSFCKTKDRLLRENSQIHGLSYQTRHLSHCRGCLSHVGASALTASICGAEYKDRLGFLCLPTNEMQDI